MIWWIWTQWRDDQDYIHTFDVLAGFNAVDDFGDAPDVAWLGEGAWVALTDNMGMGLR